MSGRTGIAILLTIASTLATTSSSSLSLEAHEAGTADGTWTNWYTDYGSYDRDFHRQKRLLITVRDFSRKVPKVTVQVYFIAHPEGRDRPLFIYGHVAVPVEFHGDLEVRGEIDAPTLNANIQNYAALGIAYVRGADIDGWIVVGEFEGRPFQFRASRQALLDLAERQPQLLRAMVADFERATKSQK